MSFSGMEITPAIKTTPFPALLLLRFSFQHGELVVAFSASGVSQNHLGFWGDFGMLWASVGAAGHCEHPGFVPSPSHPLQSSACFAFPSVSSPPH